MPKSGAEHTGSLNHIRRHNPIIYGGALWRYLYRRERLLRDENGRENFDIFPADMFFEDNSAGINMLMKATHYEIVPEPLYYYWQNPTSTVHVFSWGKMHDRVKSGFLIKDYAVRYGYYDEFKDEVEARLTEMMYIGTIWLAMWYEERDEKFLQELKTKFLSLVPDWEKNPYINDVSALHLRTLAKFYTHNHLKIGWFIATILYTLYEPNATKLGRGIKFLLTDPKTFIIKLKKNLRKLCQK